MNGRKDSVNENDARKNPNNTDKATRPKKGLFFYYYFSTYKCQVISIFYLFNIFSL